MTETPFTPGSIVRNRNRLWRVDAQVDRVLTATPIDGSEIEQQQFYLPFEHIRPGRLAPPSPDLVGHPAAQDLLLRAHRLNMLHGTAPLLSLQRSRVIPKDYQLVPVVMALEMPRVRMLIADDVGLGKTIEAGLILTELMARQMAARVLVVVPASLREQWQQQLDYFFHIPARIISTRHRRQMERELPVGANPWEYYRVLITSVDYAKQPAVKNQILEQKWDAVVIDEAHLVAKPHQSGPDHHVSMDRWELARALAASERVRHLLMLTATPHSGYTDSFASLIRMLDVGAVEGPPHEPTIIRSVARRHVCQRRRDDVKEWSAEGQDRSPFPDRDQDEVIVPPTAYEKEAIDAVEAYGRRVLENAEPGGKRSYTLARWTALHLHKRALSSPEALRCSLRNRRDSLQKRLEKRLAEAEEAGLAPDVARANVLDEDTGERLSDEEAAHRTERLPFGSPQAIRAELAALQEVLDTAQRVTARRDNKLQTLLDRTLRNRLQHDPKVIVFTRYVDTLEYLARQIARDERYADARVLTIHGSLNERRRREIFHDFERADKAVLVATDAISEGINLQHAAAQVVHYELPWNPNRLEQRNGRVDRFGQRQPLVTIRTMVMDETLDAAILKILVKKAEKIRHDYGFSPPYFSEDGDILDLLKQHDIALGPKQMPLFGPRPAQSAPQDGGEQDPFAEETLQRIRQDSFYGQTHISLPQIESRLARTEDTIGSPQEIQTFVFNGLNRFRCPVTENADGSWRIAVTNPALQTASVGHVIERATFDPEWGLDDPDVTVLDLGHPLVRRLIEEVKQEAFRAAGSRGDGDAGHYGRTTFMVTKEAQEVTAVFHLLARYVVNTDPVSIIEELLPVALPVYGTKPLQPATTQRLLQAQPAPQTRTVDEVRDTLRDALAFPDLEAVLSDAVAHRRRELAAERHEMRRRLQQQAGGQTAAWLQGIDDLSQGSFDMLTVTVYYPAQS